MKKPLPHPALLTPAGFARTLSNGRWYLAAHLALLNRKLVEVAAGRLQRLMVFMPPRHGKSEFISRYFPAWYLGAFPDNRIILASYEANFASSWGEKARDAFAEAAARGLWAHKLARAASSDWAIAGHEGGMVTAGVRGAITGRGGNLLLIDDPVKNDEEALSPTYREKTWDWYNSTFATRAEPGAGTVVMMTRWHHDDLAGRILANSPEPWEVISLPALAEADDPLGRPVGAALWPERFNEQQLDIMRRARGLFWWTSMYQQRPVPREGGIFQREWFVGKVVDALPAEARVSKRVRYWDKAATQGGGDWTAGVRMAEAGGVFYVENVKRDQLSPGGVRSLITTTADADTRQVVIGMEQEPGSAGKDVKEEFARLLRGYEFHCEPASGSKAIRAGGFATQCEAGNVFLVRSDWNADYLDELCAFRGVAGDTDDQVDGSSGAFELLTGQRKGLRSAPGTSL